MIELGAFLEKVVLVIEGIDDVFEVSSLKSDSLQQHIFPDLNLQPLFLSEHSGSNTYLCYVLHLWDCEL